MRPFKFQLEKAQVVTKKSTLFQLSRGVECKQILALLVCDKIMVASIVLYGNHCYYLNKCDYEGYVVPNNETRAKVVVA